jgi:hypothetical protein
LLAGGFDADGGGAGLLTGGFEANGTGEGLLSAGGGDGFSASISATTLQPVMRKHAATTKGIEIILESAAMI